MYTTRGTTVIVEQIYRDLLPLQLRTNGKQMDFSESVYILMPCRRGLGQDRLGWLVRLGNEELNKIYLKLGWLVGQVSSVRLGWFCQVGFVWLVLFGWFCLVGFVWLVLFGWLCQVGYVRLVMLGWLCQVSQVISARLGWLGYFGQVRLVRLGWLHLVRQVRLVSSVW